MHLKTLLTELQTRFGKPVVNHDRHTTYRWTTAAERISTHLVVAADEESGRGVIFVFDPLKTPYEIRITAMTEVEPALNKIDELVKLSR